jgi:hypothetical protein
MQDPELFLSLAEIAGVFVGFGALIAVRGGGPSSTWDVASVGVVVLGGIQVVVVALGPVVISRFPVPDHALWVSSSLLFLVVFWIVGEGVDRIFPERMAMRTAWPMKARWRMELLSGVLLLIPMQVALVLILVGVFPELEAALYFAAVALLLIVDAMSLLFVVVSGGRPHPV